MNIMSDKIVLSIQKAICSYLFVCLKCIMVIKDFSEWYCEVSWTYLNSGRTKTISFYLDVKTLQKSIINRRMNKSWLIKMWFLEIFRLNAFLVFATGNEKPNWEKRSILIPSHNPEFVWVFVRKENICKEKRVKSSLPYHKMHESVN